MPSGFAEASASTTTSARTSSGWRAATRYAFRPPIEWPTRTTGASRSCSIAAAASCYVRVAPVPPRRAVASPVATLIERVARGRLGGARCGVGPLHGLAAEAVQDEDGWAAAAEVETAQAYAALAADELAPAEVALPPSLVRGRGLPRPGRRSAGPRSGPLESGADEVAEERRGAVRP